MMVDFFLVFFNFWEEFFLMTTLLGYILGLLLLFFRAVVIFLDDAVALKSLSLGALICFRSSL